MDAALVLHLLQADPDLATRPDQAEITVVGLLRCRIVAECGGPECRSLGQVVGLAVDDKGSQAALVPGIVLLWLYSRIWLRPGGRATRSAVKSPALEPGRATCRTK